MELEQAIRISKILCQADEGRLPMILSVLEKAGVNIDGLEELEEWKALTSQGYLIDVDEFVDGLKTAFTGDEKRLTIPVRQFSAYCAERKLKPLLVKRLLAKHGYLTPTYEGERRIREFGVSEDSHILYVAYNRGPTGARELFDQGIYSTSYSWDATALYQKYLTELEARG